MVLCLKTWESRSPPSLEVLLAICMDRELSSLFHSWLESLRFVDSRSFATVVAYDGDVVSFLQFYQTTYQVVPSLDSLISVQSRDWRAWLADQKLKGLSPKTLARRLSALKSFICFLSKRESSRIIRSWWLVDREFQGRFRVQRQVMLLRRCAN